MIICGIAQSVTNVSFIWLNHMGSDPMALAVAIAIENVAGGMGTTASVGYLRNLCNKQYKYTTFCKKNASYMLKYAALSIRMQEI